MARSIVVDLETVTDEEWVDFLKEVVIITLEQPITDAPKNPKKIFVPDGA